jgi:selenocysteine lyase/cysteine desulfurase
MGKMAGRYNVHIHYTDHPRTPTDPAEYIAEYEESFEQVRVQFGYYPQVMMITHTPYVTGATLPIKQLSQLAHSKGTIVVYDGAHNTGMFDGFFDDCECDFYSGSGHKWQCGPGRTGIAFVRNQLDTTSFPLPEIVIPEGSSRGPREIDDNYAGGFQSHGNPNYPAYRAQYESCMLWDAIGRDNIHQYILDLSAYTKQLILDTFPIAGDDMFHCPWDCPPEMTSGLTTMNPFADYTDGGKIFEFRERLREEYDYIVRYTTRHMSLANQLAGAPRGYAMRISTHLFHNFDQIDGLIEAMYDLWGKMGMGASHRTIPKGDIDNTDYC